MPRIPLVETPAPATTGEIGVRADTHMYDGVAAAGQRIGSAISEMGDRMADFAQRKQEAINQGQLLDAQTKLQTGFQDYLTSLKDPKNPQNGDESTYKTRWEETQQKITEDLSAQNYSPAVRARLSGMVKAWQKETAVHVNQQVTQKQLEKAVGSYDTAYNKALIDGDAAKAHEIVQDGMARGIFNAEHGAQLIGSADRKIDHHAATRLIMEDPIAAEGALAEKDKDGKPVNYPHLDDDSRLQLTFEAHRRAVQLKQETASDLFERQQNGESISQDEITGLVGQGKLSPSQARTFMKPKKSFDPESFADLMKDVSAYDPKKDADRSHYAELMQRAAYSGLTGPAATQAVELLKQKGQFKETPAHGGLAMAGKMIDDAFNNGWLGKWKVTVPGANAWDKPTTKKEPAQWEKAQQTRAQLYSDVQAYVRQNPQAAPDEITKFLMGRMAPLRRAANAKLFTLPSATSAAPK